jgi:predicted DsbA family dithiol-disulfide isomerase
MPDSTSQDDAGFEAGRDLNSIYVDIVSDSICPWCFIGKRRFEKALAQRPDVTALVAWRPFQLNPTMPEDGLPRQEYLEAKFGSAEKVKEIYGAIAREGAGEGIDFAFERVERTPNTIHSHRLVKFAGERGLQDEMVERLFKAVFEEGRDIGDQDVLVEEAVKIGIPEEAARRYLQSDQDADEIRQADAYARQLGIQGVPCFIINRKYAISGAQSPEVFLKTIDLVLQEQREEAGDVDA